MAGDTMYHESQLRLWKYGMVKEIPNDGCDTLAPGDGGQEETPARSM